MKFPRSSLRHPSGAVNRESERWPRSTAATSMRKVPCPLAGVATTRIGKKFFPLRASSHPWGAWGLRPGAPPGLRPRKGPRWSVTPISEEPPSVGVATYLTQS